MIKIDVSQLPCYIKDCIVENPNEAKFVIDSLGNVHYIEEVFESHITTKEGIELRYDNGVRGKLTFVSR